MLITLRNSLGRSQATMKAAMAPELAPAMACCSGSFEILYSLYKEYNISKDPEQHAIAGASSGAIAAFMVAWERPNEFRKVISIVGSFVNLRGGHVYPERVLAADKKPIRAFFQDG